MYNKEYELPGLFRPYGRYMYKLFSYTAFVTSSMHVRIINCNLYLNYGDK